MNNNLTLSVTLTGDGKQLSGTVKDAQRDVSEFGATTERESKKAETALEAPGRSAVTVSDHLRDTQREARNFGTETQRSGRQATQALAQTGEQAQTTTAHLDKMRGIILGVGAALVGAFGAGSIINRADLINDADALAKSLGIATGELQAWDYAAQRTGLSAGAMGDIFKDVSDKLGDFAATGGGEAADLFENLNLNIAELQRLAPDQQLLKIGEAIATIEDPSQRIFFLESLANDATRLLPLLEDNAAGLRKLTDEAYAVGAAMDQVDIDNAVLANQAMAQLRGTTEGFLNVLAADLGPALADTVGDLTELIQEAGGAAGILDNVKDAATGVAVVMAGRYAGALGTATAAKLAATGQAIAYQRALASMAGVSTTAAAAQTALAGATRAAAGALALVGGPLGAAVIAAGAIYTFREELGLVEPQVETAVERVDTLTSSLSTNSRAALENAKAMLEAERQLAQFNAATLAMQRAQQQQRVYAEQEAWDAVGGQAAFGAGQRSEAQEALHELELQLTDVRNAGRAAADGIAEVDERLGEIGQSDADETIDRVYTSSENAAKAAAAQAKATDELGDSLGDLRNRLQPARRETIQYAQDMNTLTLAFAAGRLGVSEYLALQARLAETMAGAGDRATDLANTSADAVDDMARTWQRAEDDIDRAFRDAFTGAFDSFDDFSDRLLDAFKSLLAELAYQAFLRPIVVSFTGQLGGALGIQGMGGSTAGGISQVGGNLISTGQSVKKGYDWIMGGGGTGGWGQTFGNAASYFTGSGAGVGASALGMQGGISGTAITSANQIAGANTSSIWGNNWASGQGAGLVNAGVGMAAGYAGNWLSGSVFGESEEQNIGSTIGGTVGAIWGPVGTAVGSFLGGALGSAFSHEKTKPRTQFVTRASDGDLASLSQEELRARDWYFGAHVSQGAFGDVGVTHSGSRRVHRAFDMGAGHDASHWAQDLADAAVEMDGFIASLARSEEEVDTMAAAVQELSLRSGDVEEIFNHVLVERPLAALDAAGLKINDRFRSLGVEEFAAELAILLGVTEQLKFTTDRLNIEFDLTADNVLVVAERMSALAGGLDNLAAIQQGYYQVAFSEAERLGHQASDLQASLSAITDEVPTTVEALRALVEAQSLSSNEGQELALQLMQLAPALAHTRTELERQITEAYQTHLDRIPEASGLAYWVDEVITGAMSLEDALWSVANSGEAAISALERFDIGEIFGGVSRGLEGFREQLTLDQIGEPEGQYEYFRQQAEGMARLVGTLTDPRAIADAANDAGRYAQQAYRLLDNDQKMEMGGEVLGFVNSLEKTTMRSLEQAEDRSAEKTAKAVSDAVAREVGRIADAIIDNLRDSGDASREVVNAIRATVSQRGGQYRPGYEEVNS